MPSDGDNEPVEDDLDAQIVECNEAIFTNPRNAKAHRQRGLLKARQRHYDEALEDFERTLSLAPNEQQWIWQHDPIASRSGQIQRLSPTAGKLEKDILWSNSPYDP